MFDSPMAYGHQLLAIGYSLLVLEPLGSYLPESLFYLTIEPYNRRTIHLTHQVARHLLHYFAGLITHLIRCCAERDNVFASSTTFEEIADSVEVCLDEIRIILNRTPARDEKRQLLSRDQ